jgi:TetR/AcrR family transcriptional regulator
MNSPEHIINQTQQRIFNVAARLFAQRGYNGVSMREISETSGVSKPTVYYYFGSKEGIFTALVQAGMEHTGKYIERVMAARIPVRDKLTRLLRFRFRQALEFPELSRFFLILTNSGDQLPFLKKYLDEMHQRRAAVVELIRAGIACGEFGRSANPELAAELLMAAVSHYMYKQLNSTEVILTDRLAEDIIELLFKGLNE